MLRNNRSGMYVGLALSITLGCYFVFVVVMAAKVILKLIA